MPDIPPRPAAASAQAVRWLAFAGALAVHLAVLYAPNPDVPGGGVPGADKVVHAAIFGAVTWTGLRVGIPARWLVPLVLANALASELIQAGLLPHRSGDPWDVVADVVGVGIGIGIVWAASRRT